MWSLSLGPCVDRGRVVVTSNLDNIIWLNRLLQAHKLSECTSSSAQNSCHLHDYHLLCLIVSNYDYHHSLVGTLSQNSVVHTWTSWIPLKRKPKRDTHPFLIMPRRDTVRILMVGDGKSHWGLWDTSAAMQGQSHRILSLRISIWSASTMVIAGCVHWLILNNFIGRHGWHN